MSNQIVLGSDIVYFSEEDQVWYVDSVVGIINGTSYSVRNTYDVISEASLATEDTLQYLLEQGTFETIDLTNRNKVKQLPANLIGMY